MMAGGKKRTRLYASNWAVGSPSLHPLKPGKDLALVLAASGWMTFVAQEMRSPWSSASTGSGGITTATTRKMWLWSAHVSPVDGVHEDRRRRRCRRGGWTQGIRVFYQCHIADPNSHPLFVYFEGYNWGILVVRIIIITIIKSYHSVIECENKRGFKNYWISILILNMRKVGKKIKQLSKIIKNYFQMIEKN